MAEPVEIGELPVELNKTDQKKWDSGPEGKAEVEAKIIALRREDDPPEGDTGERAVSFDEVEATFQDLLKTTLRDLADAPLTLRGNHSWGEDTRYDGNRINWGARYMMEDAEVLLSDPHFGGERDSITVHQGSPSGSVSASAGTHSKRSVVDTSWFNYRNRVLVFRLGGSAAWYRPKSSKWIPHIHFVMCGDDGVHWLAARQVVDYWRNPPGNGLGSVGQYSDNGPKMYGARPLYVLPHRAYALNGKIACKAACHAYTRQTTNAPQYGPQINIGETLNGIFTTRDAKTGKLWVVTKNGRCVYADNFEKAV